MKTVKLYLQLTFLPLTFLFLGCGEDDGNNLELSQGEIVIFVSEDVANVTRSSTFDNTWTEGDEISISEGTKVVSYKAASTSSSSSSGFVSFVPVNTNSKGKPLTDSDAHFWPTIQTSKSFTAWYPANNELSVPWSVNDITSDQRKSTDLTDEQYQSFDLLYASTITDYKETVKFKFYHQLSHIVVIVNGSATSTNVSSVDFGNDNISVKGTINALGTSGVDATGVQVQWADIPDTDKNETINMRCKEADNTNHVYTYECILPPQSSLSSCKLITITGKRPLASGEMKDVTYTYEAAFVLKAGYQYIYRLNTSKAGVVSLSSATVLNWQATGDYSGSASYPDISYPGL